MLKKQKEKQKDCEINIQRGLISASETEQLTEMQGKKYTQRFNMCFRNRQTNRKICERNIQRGLICALETERQTERL